MNRGDLVQRDGEFGIVLYLGRDTVDGQARVVIFWGNGLRATEWVNSVTPVLLPNSEAPATFHEILKEMESG